MAGLIRIKVLLKVIVAPILLHIQITRNKLEEKLANKGLHYKEDMLEKKLASSSS